MVLNIQAGLVGDTRLWRMALSCVGCVSRVTTAAAVNPSFTSVFATAVDFTFIS